MDPSSSPSGPSNADGLLLGIGRAAEQAAYGVSMLVLASRMEVRAFGVVATIFVVNSVGLTLADLGVAHDLVRTPDGIIYPATAIRAQRLVNCAIAAVAVLLGVAVHGDTGWLVLLSGLIWVSAGESYVHQASALRSGQVSRIVIADCVSAALFFLLIALTRSSVHAVGLVGGGLIAHHLLVSLMLPIPTGAIGESDQKAKPFSFLANHTLGYLTRNVDYLLAGPLLGTAAFSSYVLGFRIANAPSAPLGSVVLRWGLARFAAETPSSLDCVHKRSATGLALVGLAGMLATLAIAGLLPVLIGDRWRTAAGVAAVLALTLPWRMIDGLVGALGFSTGAESLLVRFEAIRIIATTVALVVGAMFGLAGFVAGGAVATGLLISIGHLLISRHAKVRPVRFLLISTPVMVILVCTASVLVLGT